MEQLVEKNPDNDNWQTDLAVGHDLLGDVLQAQRDFAGALEEFRARLLINAALAAKAPTNTSRQRDLKGAHNKIGLVLAAQGDPVAAAGEYRAALAIVTQLAKEEPNNETWQSDLLDIHDKLGNALREQGDLGGAQRELVGALTASEAALKIQRQVYASRQDPTAKAALVNALGENSFYLLFNRRAEEAAARAEEALSLDPSAVWIETNRAHAYLFLGRYEQAKAIYLENKDKLLNDGRTFAQAVNDDFAMLRKHGIEIPTMHEIEVLLSAA